MSRTFFEKRKGSAAARRHAAHDTEAGTGHAREQAQRHAAHETEAGTGHAREQAQGTDAHETAARIRIYDDTDVCRVLGIRRRILVRARTPERRGIDWDVAGWHAGMTEAWIRAYNRNASIEGMKPVEESDGITTVRVARRVTNGDLAVAQRVKDGTIVTVRGIGNAWFLHIGDEMDCRMQGGSLAYAPELNREAY